MCTYVGAVIELLSSSTGLLCGPVPGERPQPHGISELIPILPYTHTPILPYINTPIPLTACPCDKYTLAITNVINGYIHTQYHVRRYTVLSYSFRDTSILPYPHTPRHTGGDGSPEVLAQGPQS